jgi:Tfp pilus assembly protein PilZ
MVLVDCSERGIRYVAATQDLPEIGAEVSGQVQLLSDRKRISVVGTVVRCWAGEVAVELKSPGIPVQAIFAEQRHLAKRFPARMS